MPLVQMLAILVDPTVPALLPDITTDASDGYLDPTLPPRNPDGRTVRTGGSGAPIVRSKRVAPRAHADSFSASVGDGSADVDVLANDDYSGSPTVVVTAGPTLAGATAEVIGTGTLTRIRYTPPPSGDGGTDEITYKLTASNNAGYSTARLTVTVAGVAPQSVGFTPDFPASGSTSYSYTVGFAADVHAGSLIVLAVNLNTRGGAGFQALPGTITDTQGNTYQTAASEGGEIAGDGAQWPLTRLYWTVAGSAGPLTITIPWTATDGSSWDSKYVAVEYPGPWAVAPVEATATGRGTVAPTTAYSVATSALGAVAAGRLVVGAVMAFANLGGGFTFTAATGFSTRQTNGAAGGVRWLTVMERDTDPSGAAAGLAAGAAVTGTLTFTLAWSCAAAVFVRG